MSRAQQIVEIFKPYALDTAPHIYASGGAGLVKTLALPSGKYSITATLGGKYKVLTIMYERNGGMKRSTDTRDHATIHQETRDVMIVFREIMSMIHHFMTNHIVNHITYDGLENDEGKISLYRRFAEKIARAYGGIVEQNAGGSFVISFVNR